MIGAKENLRLQKLITLVAIILFIIKIIAWHITQSLAILTDALESIVNIVAGLIGIYSLHLSSKPRDQTHPYGHGKIEFISAAIEGTLITVAGFFIIYKSVKNFAHPLQISKLDFGIILLGTTAVVNYVTGMICVATG